MQGFDVLCGPTVLVVTGPVIVSGIAAAVPGRATVSAIAKVPARLSFRMFTLSPHHGVEVQTCSISRAHQRLVWPSVKRNLCRTGIPMFRNTRFQKSLGKATKVAMTRFRRRNQDIHSDFGRPSLGGKPRNLRLRRLSWRPAARRSSQVYVEHAATLNHRPRRRRRPPGQRMSSAHDPVGFVFMVFTLFTRFMCQLFRAADAPASSLHLGLRAS